MQNGWVRANERSSTRPRAPSSSRCSACGRRTSRRCPPTSRAGHRPAVLRGPRIARARASASGSRRPRRPADLVVRRDPARRNGGGRDRPGNGMPSRLVLPQVPGVAVSAQLPPCPGLRGEPCRDYVPFENDTSSWTATPAPRVRRRSYAPLVPAYKSCSAPNSSHGAPLSFSSCNPPDLESQFLTVGTPDSNGKEAKSVGSCGLHRQPRRPATPADEADVRIAVSLTDVRRQADLDGLHRRARGRPHPADHRQAKRRRGRRAGHGQRLRTSR